MKNDQLNYQENWKMNRYIAIQGTGEDLEGLYNACETLFNIKILQYYSFTVRGAPLVHQSQETIKRQQRQSPDLPGPHYFLTEGPMGLLPRLNHRRVDL